MLRLVYYPWITQGPTPQEIADNVGIFARQIELDLQSAGAADTVQMLPPIDVPQQIKQVIDGSVDIALMNPLGFVCAKVMGANAEAVAVAKRVIDDKEGIEYFAQLYARKKTAIKNLKDAKSIGYGAVFSTSNFLFPALMLKKAGVHPLLGIDCVQFLKGHDSVAEAVDIGAGHDGVINNLANRRGYGDARDVLERVQRSSPIPSDPVVVTNPNARQRDQLKEAIVAAGNTQDGRAALGKFWGDVKGLQKTTSAAYEVVEDALKILKLEPSDILPS
jgi:ABC-type phosphate/phosphonate transport system substrate-binding protein